MKKFNFILVLIIIAANLFAAGNWDIIDKSMAEYDQDGGNAYDRAWEIAKGDALTTINVIDQTYVNFTKTGKWAWLRPSLALTDIEPGKAYSIEVKARVNNGDGNQLALRLANTATTPIYIKYGDAESGSVSTKSNLSNAFKMNTSEWQIYRIVFRADLKYDVYIDGMEEPVFEGEQGGTNSDQNGIYIGAESDKVCDIDIEYVKVGTGDFFSNPKISSVTLSHKSHITGHPATVSVTATTVLIANGENLLFSLVDEENNETVAPVRGIVKDNVATADIEIPDDVAKGRYYVKVAAPDGKIGNLAVKAKTEWYDVNGEWDIVNKSFAVAWDQNDSNLEAEKAWIKYVGTNLAGREGERYSFTQEEGFVNLTKFYAASGSNSLSLYTDGSLPVLPNTAYTFEYKVRINPIDKIQYPDDDTGWELNLLVGRINGYESAICLGYDDNGNGYLTLKREFANITEADRVPADISEWNVYRFVVSEDATKFDLYMNGELIFEDAPALAGNSDNIQSLGSAAPRARCNIDIESARMRTGNFGLKTKISSVVLSHYSHVTGNAATVQVTANTASIDNGEKLLFSFSDEDDNEILATVEATVTDNIAIANIVIPANIPAGQYYVKVAAPNDQIDGVRVEARTVRYDITGIWDILDKSMSAWNVDGGSATNKAWTSTIGTNLTTNDYSITQESDYVNLTKTGVGNQSHSASLNNSNNALTVQTNTSYTIDIKARVNQLDKEVYPDASGIGFESNMISPRINGKLLSIYLRYTDDGRGFITLAHELNINEEDRYYADISQWHVYRFILSADNTSFDLYVDGETIPLIENAATSSMSGSNIIRIGAEARGRCDIDVEYARMGTGSFYPTPEITPEISSLILSSESHIVGNENTVSVTANIIDIADNKKLLFSLIDTEGVEILTPVEGTVTNNVAKADLVIPASVPVGQYSVKVYAPDNKIGDITVAAKTAQYEIKEDDTTNMLHINNEECVYVSANILMGGQNLSVKSDNVFLSELILYSITGNEVYRNSVSGNDYSFTTPTTAGLYLLSVKLDNGLSKEFKIIVK